MRLLVVEDFDLLRESVVQGLREAGYAVDSAADGQQGLWYARSNAYDLIILDIMLPKLSGLDILRHTRAAGSKSHILLLTARDTPKDRITGLDLGADDYLIKPFEFGELLARVRALLRRAYNQKNPRIIIDDLQIDTIARTVQRGTIAIPLTAREYALLEYLARRAGNVVTRTDVWESLYEFNSDAQSNVVDVFIGHLRRKIDLPGLPKLIHTRRGFGYVLEVQP